MNKTSWIIFTVFTIGILTLLVVISGGSRIDVSKVDTNKIQTANNQNGNIADHVFGNADSKVILIEYGDFQCPPCAQISPTIKEVSEEYKNQIGFVFRNFPITTSHPNAKAAAGTAEAAGLQGKYWEMHDKIYATQSDWSSLAAGDRDKLFEGFARDLKLNITKFKSDLITTAISDKIDFDSALGKKAGVDSTPSIYLNGKKLTGASFGSVESLKNTLNAELKKNGIALPQ